MATVRYITRDATEAAQFYVDQFGFEVKMNPNPGFAMLVRGDLRLLLNQPGAGGAGTAADDGRLPEPGGWNRFQIEVADLAGTVERLRSGGCTFRTSIAEGGGGRQALLEDPDGNLVELMEPAPR
jgi:catechol 2,3-dioxygenase-like lactoylglutathione lyase family enzyme